MPKVLISDDLSPRAVEIFKERGIEVTMNTSLTPDQLKAEIGKYDGLADPLRDQGDESRP